MYLNNLHSEPSGLFPEVTFKNGLNFIFGEKDDDDPKMSINSIGKSTFLDLMDFVMLSSYNKAHNQRLFKAKNIMSDYVVVLNFDIGKETYIIKRGVDDPNYVEFGLVNDELVFYPIKKLKEKLAKLIFGRVDYNGTFISMKWFRNLASFYLKIQKFKKAKFLDPIKFIPELTEPQLNVYHFYLLGLNNNLPNKIFENRVNQKGLSNTVKEIARYVEEKYDIKDLKQAQLQTNKLKLDIKKLSTSIDRFELGEQYEDAEKQANELTEKIKNNIYHNYKDGEVLRSYESSFKLPSKVNTRRILSMYKQISEELSIQIKKTVVEAVDFRKKINASRKEFLSLEIEKIKNNINLRNELVSKFEKERAKIFYFLSAKEAITDLTEAFYNLSKKKNDLGDLESNTKILLDLKNELNEIQAEFNKLSAESIVFINDSIDDIFVFAEKFNLIYDSIYINKSDESQFSIIGATKKNSIMEIDVTLPDMFGKGKNQGRTLVYDLSVLTHNIEQTNNFPRFMIHDGIFDGVDKAHFISVCKFVESFSNNNNRIQYITTINEEGTLSDKFGDEEYASAKFIKDNSILTLSPKNKLFNVDF